MLSFLVKSAVSYHLGDSTQVENALESAQLVLRHQEYILRAGKAPVPDIRGIGGDRVPRCLADLGIAAVMAEIRPGRAEHVRDHEHLAVGSPAGANADRRGRDGEFGPPATRARPNRRSVPNRRQRRASGSWTGDGRILPCPRSPRAGLGRGQC